MSMSSGNSNARAELEGQLQAAWLLRTLVVPRLACRADEDLAPLALSMPAALAAVCLGSPKASSPSLVRLFLSSATARALDSNSTLLLAVCAVLSRCPVIAASAAAVVSEFWRLRCEAPARGLTGSAYRRPYMLWWSPELDWVLEALQSGRPTPMRKVVGLFATLSAKHSHSKAASHAAAMECPPRPSHVYACMLETACQMGSTDALDMSSRSDQVWQRAQERAFASWADRVLRACGDPRGVADLWADLVRGDRLLLFFRALHEPPIDLRGSAETSAEPALRIRMIDDASRALSYLRGPMRVRSTCSAENIVDHDRPEVLGLLWPPAAPDEPGEAEAALAAWARAIASAEPYGIPADSMASFASPAFADGRAFLALVHAWWPAAFDYAAVAAGCAGRPRERVAAALDAAQELMGVPKLVTADDVASGAADARSLTLYTALLYQAHVARAEEERRARESEEEAAAEGDELPIVPVGVVVPDDVEDPLEASLACAAHAAERQSSRLGMERQLFSKGSRHMADLKSDLRAINEALRCVVEEVRKGRRSLDDDQRFRSAVVSTARSSHRFLEVLRRTRRYGVKSHAGSGTARKLAEEIRAKIDAINQLIIHGQPEQQGAE
eukprot:m51a1_g7802 hypothetical protein (616) ;mRNA; r:65475-68628